MAPADIYTLWTGMYNREQFLKRKLELSKDFMDPHECDYGRACLVNESLHPLSLGNGSVLVLGDEPMPTSIFTSKENRFCMARWHSGLSKENVEEKLLEASFTDNNNLVPPLEFYLSTDKLFVFDSAVCPLEFENEMGSYLEMNIKQGTYLIDTIGYEPDDSSYLIIHQFTLKI